MRSVCLRLLSPVFFMSIVLSSQTQSSPCGMDCMVGTPSVQDIADILNDLVDSSQTPVMVSKDEESGAITVTLGDGTQFSVETVGLLLGHQNMHQQQINQGEDGSLHLRSQAGMEVRIRAAMHREAELVGEMYNSGWTEFFWFEEGIEVNSPAGDRLCLTPDMEISSEQSVGETAINIDSDGNLVVIYADGVRQRLHACAHDPVQLRDHIRNITDQQLIFDTNGLFTLEVDGEMMQFRLNSLLHQSGILDQPGIFSEESRIYIRYRDGWEQDIIGPS